MVRRSFLRMALIAILFTGLWAQDAAPNLLSPLARLTAAHTAYLKNAGGNELPFNVVSEGVEGWGRYRIVNSPEKSDIIIEVTSPDGAGGVSVSSTTATPTTQRIAGGVRYQFARIVRFAHHCHRLRRQKQNGTMVG